jgi:hypothetical protein
MSAAIVQNVHLIVVSTSSIVGKVNCVITG